MSRIAVLTGDVIQEKLAGPAVRALELAGVLSRDNDVVVACPGKQGDRKFPFPVIEYGNQVSTDFLNSFDACIAPGSLIVPGDLKCKLVVDLYDPFILSNMHRFKMDNSLEFKQYEDEFEILAENLLNGDYFICANERQRDFWIGMLTAYRRINRLNYSVDAELYSLIDIVPYGISSQKPIPVEQKPFPNFGDGTRWILWGGGIWNWFDPLILIRAMERISAEIPDAKLYFMGTSHPDPAIPEMKKAVETIALAEKLGLKNKCVFFGDWIPYFKRVDFLMAAHVGVSTHLPHLETRFSFRTRILDYIWAGLPILCTEGDSLAELVANRGMGITVPPGDLQAISSALLRLLTEDGFHKHCKENIAATAVEMTWEKIAKPLVSYCRNPVFAPDKSLNDPLSSAKTEVFIAGTIGFNAAVGEIYGDFVCEQFFVCRYDGLCRIDLKPATYARRNQGVLLFSIEDMKTGEVIFCYPVNMETVLDNQWLSLRFGPVPNSRGRTYRMRFESQNSRPGNALTVWSDNTVDTHYFFHGERRSGSLTFRAFCRVPSQARGLFRAWERIFKKKYF